MDIASVLGSILIFVLMILAISFDSASDSFVFSSLQYFWDAPSIVIVLLGSFIACLAGHPLNRFLALPKIIGSVFKGFPNSLINTLVIIVDVAKIARKNILAMEDALPSIENEYLRNGLRLVVDRVDRELIIDMLMSELKYVDKRKESDMNIIKLLSQLSPAFGMIGTLIGLVVLLQNLDDPSKIGPAMAMALITTFYGAFFSNALFVPWYNKLSLARDEEKVLYEMIRDGILFIEKNERPEFIEQDLLNYLSPELKVKYEDLKFSSEKGK